MKIVNHQLLAGTAPAINSAKSVCLLLFDPAGYFAGAFKQLLEEPKAKEV
jgi:hypothetical protein